MFVFHRAPLLRLLLPLIAGIVFASVTGFVMPLWAALLLLAACAVMLVATLRRPMLTLRRPGIEGVPVFVAMIIFGFAWSSLQTPESRDTHFTHFVSGESALLVQVDEMPVPKTRSIKTIVQVKAVQQRGRWLAVSGKLLCYLGNSSKLTPAYGQTLLVHGNLQPVNGPMNPDEFDYRKYLAIHGITHQLYADSLSWAVTSISSTGNLLKSKAIAWRTYLLGVLQRAGLSGTDYGVVAALVLGDDDHIDPGLMHAYAASGTLHVLSVSGLHVAIVYLIFNAMLGFLLRFKNGLYIKAVLLITVLWMYALLTGMSPSVLRSAAMLSFVVGGSCMRQRPHILNTLAASAIVLLLVDPYLLFDVGFQLSYTAVAGIVLIEPFIREKYEPGNWLMRQVWGLTSVSLAAQLATFPLGFYYFQQFPVYFLLANLVVIPLSTVVMYAGMLLLVFAAVPYVSDFIVAILKGTLFLLNGSVRLTETLPGAVIHTTRIGLLQLFLLYTFAGGLFLFWIRKHLRWLQLAGVSGIALLLLLLVQQQRESAQRELLVYSLKQASGIGFISGTNAVLLGDSTFYNQENLAEFHIEPHLQNCGVTGSEQYALVSDSVLRTPLVHRIRNWLQFGNKTLVLAQSELFLPDSVASPAIDLLLVNKSCRLKPEQVLRYYRPQCVVLDGTVSRKRSAWWTDVCIREKIPVHDVKTKGAYVLRW
jgi:competence protein ComEC